MVQKDALGHLCHVIHSTGNPTQRRAQAYSLNSRIYLVSFVDMLLQSVQSELVPYVTSAFRSHGLLATTSVVSTIVGGVSKLTIAKIIDIWGRAQGFAIMLLLIIIGMIMS